MIPNTDNEFSLFSLAHEYILSAFLSERCFVIFISVLPMSLFFFSVQMADQLMSRDPVLKR